MGLAILLGLFALSITFSLPVAYAIGLGTVAAFAYEGLPLLIAFQRIVSGVSVLSLLAAHSSSLPAS